MVAPGQRTLRSSTANMGAQMQEGGGGLSNTGPGSSEKQPLSEEGKASVTLISGQTPTEEQGRDPHTMSSDAQAPWVGSGGGHGDGSDEVDAWGMHLSPSLC